jgi:hypothetical protein
LFTFRYHVISLVAVFLALGIGVLLGASIADEPLSEAQKDLEGSLRGDLRSARNEASDLRGEVRTRDAFERQAYPGLVKDLLPGFRIGIVAIGDLPSGYATRVRDAVEPAGAEVKSISVIRAPLPLGRLEDTLGGTRLRRLDRDDEALSRFGKRMGRGLVNGAELVETVRHTLFSSSRGEYRGLDGVVCVRDREGLEGDDKHAEDRFEDAFLDGLRSTEATIVAIETRSTDPSQVPFMKEHGISTVDDVDLVAGRAALVYALLGADGHFGVKRTADGLLPPSAIELSPSAAPAGR